jgi:hypothetical protein
MAEDTKAIQWLVSTVLHHLQVAGLENYAYRSLTAANHDLQGAIARSLASPEAAERQRICDALRSRVSQAVDQKTFRRFLKNWDR